MQLMQDTDFNPLSGALVQPAFGCCIGNMFFGMHAQHLLGKGDLSL